MCRHEKSLDVRESRWVNVGRGGLGHMDAVFVCVRTYIQSCFKCVYTLPSLYLLPTMRRLCVCVCTVHPALSVCE